MLKIVAVFIVIGALGLIWLPNFSGALQMAENTLKHYLDKNSDLYILVSKLFILGSHPLFQISMSAGILIFGARILFT